MGRSYEHSSTPRIAAATATAVLFSALSGGCGSYSHIRYVPSDGSTGKDQMSLDLFDPSVRHTPSEQGPFQFYRNALEFPNRPEDTGDSLAVQIAPISYAGRTAGAPFRFLDWVLYDILGEPQSDDGTVAEVAKTVSRGAAFVPYGIRTAVAWVCDRLPGGSTLHRALADVGYSGNNDLRGRHGLESGIVTGAAFIAGATILGLELAGDNDHQKRTAGNPVTSEPRVQGGETGGPGVR